MLLVAICLALIGAGLIWFGQGNPPFLVIGIIVLVLALALFLGFGRGGDSEPLTLASGLLTLASRGEG